MTSAEQTTLRLLRQLKKQDAAPGKSDPDVVQPSAAPGEAISAVAMLDALSDAEFDLHAAILRVCLGD